MPQEYDWRKVVDLKPKGYLEIQKDGMVFHGPIAEVSIDEADNVVFRLKWTAQIKLVKGGPAGEWEAITNEPFTLPNFMVPYVIEEMPEKGPRVRFGYNILFLNEVQGLDPARVRGLALPAE